MLRISPHSPLVYQALKTAGETTTPGSVKIDGYRDVSITTMPPTGLPQKFGKINIVQLSEADGPLQKYCLRTSDSISLEVLERLNHARKLMPPVAFINRRWFGSSYIEGKTSEDFVKHLIERPNSLPRIARDCAEALVLFAMDSLLLKDVDFTIGHNVLIKKRDGKIGFYDWDALIPMNACIEDILIEWLQRHLYFDLIARTEDRPQDMALQLMRLIVVNLFKLVPTLGWHITEKQKQKVYLPDHPLFDRMRPHALDSTHGLSIERSWGGFEKIFRRYSTRYQVRPDLTEAFRSNRLPQLEDWLVQYARDAKLRINLLEII